MSLQVNKHKAELHLIRTLFPRQYFVDAHGQTTSTGELTCQYPFVGNDWCYSTRCGNHI